MEDRLKPIYELTEGIEADGLPGLLRIVARMVDPDGPSAECIQSADNCMDSAVGDEEYYGCALDMAHCLREAVLAPEEPEPEEPEPEEPEPEEPEPEEPEPEEPEPESDRIEDLGDLVLAVLVGHLRRLSKT